MSTLHILGLGAAGGTGLAAAQTGKYARHHAALDDHAEDPSANDRSSSTRSP